MLLEENIERLKNDLQRVSNALSIYENENKLLMREKVEE